MHELSIAENLITLAGEAALSAGVTRVTGLHLRVGALSGVLPDALRFGYDIAAVGTPLEGSRLLIEEIPAAIYCQSCACVMELPSIQSFACPNCGSPSGDIRQGHELEIIALEVEDEQPAYS